IISLLCVCISSLFSVGFQGWSPAFLSRNRYAARFTQGRREKAEGAAKTFPNSVGKLALKAAEARSNLEKSAESSATWATPSGNKCCSPIGAGGLTKMADNRDSQLPRRSFCNRALVTSAGLLLVA